MYSSDLEFSYDVFYKVGREGVVSGTGQLSECERLRKCMWSGFRDDFR